MADASALITRAKGVFHCYQCWAISLPRAGMNIPAFIDIHISKSRCHSRRMVLASIYL